MKGVVCGVLLLTSSACTLGNIRHTYNAQQYQRERDEDMQKSRECQERGDMECARYWLEASKVAQEGIESEQGLAQRSQASFANAALMLGAMNATSNQNRLRTTCSQAGPYVNCW